MDARKTKQFNINFIKCYKAEIYKAHVPIADPSHAFHKTLKRDNIHKLCLWILEEYICLILTP